MDKISDFFSEIKERGSSPFFSSFIISWLVFNWRIPVALFFYNSKAIEADGYTSLGALIADQISIRYSFVSPILSAIGYIFIYPFFRNVAAAFNSWTKAWGEKLSLKYAKSGSISIKKYIELRGKYTNGLQLLEKTLEDEQKSAQKILELENLGKVTEGVLKKVNDELNRAKFFQNVNILNGEWIFRKDATDNFPQSETTLFFENGKVYELWTEQKDKKLIGRVDDFSCNSLNDTIFFYLNTAHIKNLNAQSHFYTLNFNNSSIGYLTGEEDKKTKVYFSRVS